MVLFAKVVISTLALLPFFVFIEKRLGQYWPDTYFDYGEWNKFLFERGNLRLIRAAVESNEIYLKNEQEYRKCLKMVDTVIQNRYEKQFGLQP